MPRANRRQLTITTDGVEKIVMQLGDVAYAEMTPQEAWIVGSHLLEKSCKLRGLKDPLFIIEPAE